MSKPDFAWDIFSTRLTFEDQVQGNNFQTDVFQGRGSNAFDANLMKSRGKLAKIQRKKNKF